MIAKAGDITATTDCWHQALSLREVALLQTFPSGYRFCGTYESVERQIGNAVPVQLAHALGLAVRRMLNLAQETERP